MESQMMLQAEANQGNEMNAAPAVMTMTLEITRAATGKTETVQIVCTPQTETEQPKETQPCQ